MFDFFLSDRERDIACMQTTGYPRRYRERDYDDFYPPWREKDEWEENDGKES